VVRYALFVLVWGGELASSAWLWYQSSRWWHDYQSQFTDAATYDPAAVRQADEHAFAVSLAITLLAVSVAVAVVLLARRYDRGPLAAGLLALVGVLVVLAVSAPRSSDQQLSDCYTANPKVYVGGTRLQMRGWSWADGGQVAIWRGRAGRTVRIVC
jgi:hypothetical protein